MDKIERLRALEKKWREMANDRANAEWVTLVNCANELRDLIAELGQEVGAVADEYGWVEGPPHRILSKEEGEWFIAETTYGDRVVLKGLPEEYAYDFTTADSTYFKRGLIKRWRQFPDSEYKPLGDTSPAHTSEARDAVLKGVRELAIKAAAHWDADEDMKVGKILMALAGQLPKYDKRADAFDAAMRQEGGE